MIAYLYIDVSHIQSMTKEATSTSLNEEASKNQVLLHMTHVLYSLFISK